MFSFKIKSQYKNARTGILKTPHGEIETPEFVPVATKGMFKGVPFELINPQIAIINTYHLWVNNRYKIIKKYGGLHKYFNIKFPLMTDSGGFQVFSLGASVEHKVGKISNIFPGKKIEKIHSSSKRGFVKITDKGVYFTEPKSGKKLFLTPELSIKIQKALGADINFAFDECTSPLDTYEYTKKSLERTHNWALTSLKAFGQNKNQVLFGIIQGGEFKDLREESAKFISALPFFGFGIGGSLGKTKKDMIKILNWVMPILPQNKPKHLLGIGEIDDIFNIVEQGIDLFDCVIPTRWARHGVALTFKGKMNMKSAKRLNEFKPIDQKCNCFVCKNYTRSTIAHLIKEKELNGITLLSIHNLNWILNLTKLIRKSIKNKTFNELKKSVLKYY